MSTVPLHLRNFNDKVRLMHQTNARSIVLTLIEATNIQSEMFVLLAENVRLTRLAPAADNTMEQLVGLDGGRFD